MVTKKKLLKIIAFILINAFLMLEVVWAGEIALCLSNRSYLATKIQIRNQYFIDTVAALYKIKNDSKIRLALQNDLSKVRLMKKHVIEKQDNIQNTRMYIKQITNFVTCSSDISKLIQQNNSFDLTVRKYSRDDIKSFIQDKNTLVFTLEQKNAIGKVSILGSLIVAKRAKGAWVIVSFCLQRLKKEKTLGKAFLATVMQELKIKGIENLRGYYIQGVRNQGVERLYKELNFEHQTSGGYYLDDFERSVRPELTKPRLVMDQWEFNLKDKEIEYEYEQLYFYNEEDQTISKADYVENIFESTIAFKEKAREEYTDEFLAKRKAEIISTLCNPKSKEGIRIVEQPVGKLQQSLLRLAALNLSNWFEIDVQLKIVSVEGKGSLLYAPKDFNRILYEKFILYNDEELLYFVKRKQESIEVCEKALESQKIIDILNSFVKMTTYFLTDEALTAVMEIYYIDKLLKMSLEQRIHSDELRNRQKQLVFTEKRKESVKLESFLNQLQSYRILIYNKPIEEVEKQIKQTNQELYYKLGVFSANFFIDENMDMRRLPTIRGTLKLLKNGYNVPFSPLSIQDPVTLEVLNLPAKINLFQDLLEKDNKIHQSRIQGHLSWFLFNYWDVQMKKKSPRVEPAGYEDIHGILESEVEILMAELEQKINYDNAELEKIEITLNNVLDGKNSSTEKVLMDNTSLVQFSELCIELYSYKILILNQPAQVVLEKIKNINYPLFEKIINFPPATVGTHTSLSFPINIIELVKNQFSKPFNLDEAKKRQKSFREIWNYHKQAGESILLHDVRSTVYKKIILPSILIERAI